MALLRPKLPSLDEMVSPLVMPVTRRGPVPEGREEYIKNLRNTPAPMHAAVTFLNVCNDLDTPKTKKRYKFHLTEIHLKVFGVYPELGTPLEVVKARCAYRLQYEGHRITGTTPSNKFMQNYRALMAFRKDDHFKGTTEDVYSLGNRLTDVCKGEISMAIVKKAEGVAKKAAKVAKKASAPGAVKKASRRILALGLYPATMLSTWYGQQGYTTEQIQKGFKQLGITASEATIARYRVYIPNYKLKPKPEDVKKLLYVMPKLVPVETKKEVKKAAPKKAAPPAAKKVIKKAAPAPAAAK
jgi:hypothetical protein